MGFILCCSLIQHYIRKGTERVKPDIQMQGEEKGERYPIPRAAGLQD